MTERSEGIRDPSGDGSLMTESEAMVKTRNKRESSGILQWLERIKFYV